MLAFLFCLARSDPEFPSWPKQYTLRGTWQIPYWNIRQPMKVVTDLIKGRTAEIAYGGLQINLHFLNDRTVSEQVYKKNGEAEQTSLYCRWSPISSADDKLIEYLPVSDLNDWKYQGVRPCLGKNCHVWRKELGYNNFYYEFYVTEDLLHPVRYLQFGNNMKGGHPTTYIFDIEEWGTQVDEFDFLYPADCLNGSEPFGPSFGLNMMHRQAMNGIAPIEQDMCRVEKEDKFSDVPSLPTEFSWRNFEGVVPPVRDQAICGSCWAQAATEAASAQIGMRTGKRTTVSVQQMIDCAWDAQNMACDGGDGYTGYFELMNKSLTLVSEEEYPYLGVGSVCPKNWSTNLGARIKDCAQIWENGDKQHSVIKKALYKYGPLMVYIRAGVQPFTRLSRENPYFSNSEFCDTTKWDKNVVDHGVLLTGWKTHEGKNYLEIMNSWSTDWGEDGFGYIDEAYDCGIESMVLVPELEFLQ